MARSTGSDTARKSGAAKRSASPRSTKSAIPTGKDRPVSNQEIERTARTIEQSAEIGSAGGSVAEAGVIEKLKGFLLQREPRGRRPARRQPRLSRCG